MDNNILLDFGEPAKENSIIKVIGVGGGGGNAVNHMYREGIHDVSFVLCNTDNQALNDSPVPVHLQLGKEGLGLPLKRVWKISSKCSATAHVWPLLPLVWVVVRVLVQPQSLPASLKRWVF